MRTTYNYEARATDGSIVHVTVTAGSEPIARIFAAAWFTQKGCDLKTMVLVSETEEGQK